MDLSIERWEGLKAAERKALAGKLAEELPTGFAFEAVRLFQLGGRRHHVALYRQGDATFALIPGGEVGLGYDAGRPWEPNPDELRSWQSSAEEYGFKKKLPAFIASVTRRPRRVTLAPFLVETEAGELGWDPIPADDPEVRAILKEYRAGSQVEVNRGDVCTRVRRGADGTVVAERARRSTHADLAARLKAGGFRFPTSDEWEYACGAGAPTLFRWGDHVPCDRYPTDISPAQAAWRRRWVLSGGKLKRPAGGFQADWELHRQPNAFGLRIAFDPYKFELTAEPGVTRGGDGGCTICGGVGFFLGWLTLATAYFEKESCKHDPKEPVMSGYTVGRRVLDLG